MNRHQGEGPHPLATDEAPQSSSGSGKLTTNRTAGPGYGLSTLVTLVERHTSGGRLFCGCHLAHLVELIGEPPSQRTIEAAFRRAERQGLVERDGRTHPTRYPHPGVRPGDACTVWRGRGGVA